MGVCFNAQKTCVVFARPWAPSLHYRRKEGRKWGEESRKEKQEGVRKGKGRKHLSNIRRLIKNRKKERKKNTKIQN